MSRPRLFIGGVAFFLVVLVVAVSVLAASPSRQNQRDSDTARVEYTVASASTAAAPGPVVGGPVAVPARRGGFPVLPESLTLVFVGSMLIGLAAAVRRTT